MFNLFKFIHIPIFAISLCVGILVVYMMNQTQVRKVYVFPTPDNEHIIQYKDSTDTCFHVKQTRTQCPMDKTTMIKIPIQS
jgi:hypothetical protein